MSEYIDFLVSPYAIVDILLVLHKQGVRELAITKEDGDLHIRIPVSHLQEIEQRSNSHKTTNNEQACCSRIDLYNKVEDFAKSNNYEYDIVQGKEDVSIKLQKENKK